MFLHQTDFLFLSYFFYSIDGTWAFHKSTNKNSIFNVRKKNCAFPFRCSFSFIKFLWIIFLQFLSNSKNANYLPTSIYLFDRWWSIPLSNESFGLAICFCHIDRRKRWSARLVTDLLNDLCFQSESHWTWRVRLICLSFFIINVHQWKGVTIMMGTPVSS